MAYYELDIPRFCTALADWLACLIYIKFYLPPRFGGWKRKAFHAAALVLLSVHLVATDGHDGIVFNLFYSGSIALMLLFFRTATKGDRMQCIFFCSRSVVLAGFAASLTWQLYVYFAPGFPILQSFWALGLFVCLCYAGIFLLDGWLDSQQAPESVDFQISPRTAVNAAIIALVIYVLSSISYTGVDTPFTANGRMEIYAARSIVYFGGVALLMAYQSQICDLLTQREADALRNMLHIQYENYKMRQESIDLINRKYHDLKHQIAILRSETPSSRTQILDQMEQEIKSYEANNDTGNKVLDTVLTGKSLTCSAQNIQLTCVADGTALNFMDVMDISNLFGNALDNAIESTSKISDPQRRLIHLSVSRQKGFAAIRIENCYEGALKFEKGLPVTTKADSRYHGFGLKSIQATARKYGGSATVSTHEGWFELRVLIPLTQN